MKILWLCSWYPHPGNTYEGDFIQRHAKASGLFAPPTVFYVRQDGTENDIKMTELDDRQEGVLREKIISFRFKKKGLPALDRLIYHLRYLSTYKKYIRQHIVKEGKPDLVHIHVPMKAGVIGRWIKKNWKIPYIVSEHSSHYSSASDDNFSDKTSRHQKTVKKIFRDAAAVTNVSAAGGKDLEKLFELKNVTVIRNTVDTNLFYYSKPEHQKFRFIHVSTLAGYQKNIDGMLNAIKTLSGERQDFEWVMVGPASDILMEKVNKMGLGPFIRFAGEISYPEVAAQMQTASAFVLFSRYENFPCVIIEALCCGLPVIATDTGGVKETVNEKNGKLVQSENEAELVLAMREMMDQYKIYDRERIAYDAKRQYSYEAIGIQFYELYERTIEHSKRNLGKKL